MKRTVFSMVGSIGVAMLTLFGDGVLLQGDQTGNNSPREDPRIEELHVRLRGTKA